MNFPTGPASALKDQQPGLPRFPAVGFFFKPLLSGVFALFLLLTIQGCSLESTRVINEDNARLEAEISALQGKVDDLKTVKNEIDELRKKVVDEEKKLNTLLEKNPEVKRQLSIR